MIDPLMNHIGQQFGDFKTTIKHVLLTTNVTYINKT